MVAAVAAVSAASAASAAPAVGSAGGHNWKEKAAPGNGFVKGKFSKVESDKLRAAIEEYARRNGISTQMLATRSVRKVRGGGVGASASVVGVNAGASVGAASSSSGRGLNNAWIVIANMADLPHRTLMSIYNHGCRIANKFNYKGAWSDAEVAKLRGLVQLHGKKWTKISAELQREVRGIQQKWKKIQDSDRVKSARNAVSGASKARALVSANGTAVELGTAANAIAAANAATAAVSVTPSKTTGQSREEIVKLLITQVRANSGSDSPWPVSGIRWSNVARSFPGRTVGSLRERWNTILAKNLTFSSAEDQALVRAVAACNAKVPDEVPWTRLRSHKEYLAAYGKGLVPPERPGQHYRRRFMKLERNAWAQGRGAWEQMQKQTGKPASSDFWGKHLEQKRNQPWANRVKEVQAFVASRTNTGSSPAAVSAVAAAPAIAPVAVNLAPHANMHGSVTAV